jgi:hypothetical protein
MGMSNVPIYLAEAKTCGEKRWCVIVIPATSWRKPSLVVKRNPPLMLRQVSIAAERATDKGEAQSARRVDFKRLLMER